VATPTLRPLGVGEVLDAGIKLYIRHWRVFAVCVLIFALPLEIIDILIRASIDPDALRLGADATRDTASDTDSALVGGSVLVNILEALTLALSNLACYKAVSDAWLGYEPDVSDSLRLGLRRLLPSIGLGIVLAIVLLLAFIALILPGIWLGVAFSLAGPILVLERLGPFASMGRSFNLISGRWWASFGTLLLSVLLLLVLGVIVGLVFGAIIGLVVGDSVAAGATANFIIDTISNVVGIPFFAAILVIMYYDRRVRKEGLDMQLQESGGEPEPEDQPEPELEPESEPRSRDDRADWQPPDAPRGPSGL
jgi:hypothetical protein